MRGNREKLAVAFVVVGLLCLAASWFVPAIVPSGGTWDGDSAIQLQKAAANYHDAIHSRIHSDASDSASELGRARAEYEQLEEQLNRSQSRKRLITLAMRWTGVLLAAIGVVLYIRRLG